MKSLFPKETLAFDRLLDAVGPNPEPIVKEFEAEQQARAKCRMARARRLYQRADESHPVHEIMHDFVWCFGDCQKSFLFRTLASEWENQNWRDAAFGAFLRASIKTGNHTSALLDAVEVHELAQILRRVPRASLQTDIDMQFASSLSGKLKIYRGGWADSAECLFRRSVSWTTEFDVAEDFVYANVASMHPGQWPFHVQAEVDLDDILMICAHESEVLVDPDSIVKWEAITSPMVRKYQSFAADYDKTATNEIWPITVSAGQR